jgi:hypothetical protein
MPESDRSAGPVDEYQRQRVVLDKTPVFMTMRLARDEV